MRPLISGLRGADESIGDQRRRKTKIETKIKKSRALTDTRLSAQAAKLDPLELREKVHRNEAQGRNIFTL